MRRLRMAAVLTVATLAAACGDLFSLHALYTADDRVLDPAIEGVWHDDDDIVIVARNGDGNDYRMTLVNKHKPTETAAYEVHLVDIAGARFADLIQEDAIGHMIVRGRVADGKLRFAFFDSKWLRDRVPHEEASSGFGPARNVLTIRTSELRELVARYANEPKAFDEETVFHR